MKLATAVIVKVLDLTAMALSLDCVCIGTGNKNTLYADKSSKYYHDSDGPIVGEIYCMQLNCVIFTWNQIAN